MRRTAYRVLLPLALLATIVFFVFLVNQTLQLVEFAERLHPRAGQGALWGLVFLYAICLVVPIVLILRLPRRLEPPRSEDSPAFERYLDALRRRLRRNPLTRERPLETREQIAEALAVLNTRADELIRNTGSQVFLATAISQNGSLDAILVLTAQTKMVWQVAHVYNQRPSLRDIGYLYSNVAATAFVAGELDDLDLSTHVQPVVSGVLGSVAGAIPGLQVASSLFVNSVFNGTANAFLTLRVGLIARQYCGTLVRPERRALRRSALAGATGMLGVIAVDGARRVSRAFVEGSSRSVTGSVKALGGRVKGAGSSLAGKLGLKRSGAPEP